MDEVSQLKFVITAETGQATQATQEQATAQKELGAATDRTTKSIDSQNITTLTQLATVMAIHRGISNISRASKELGIITAEQAKQWERMNIIIGGVVGTFQLFRGVTSIINMVRIAETQLAAVETYRAVLNNPAAFAAVALGIGVAGGVGGYFASQAMMGNSGGGGGTTVHQTVNFNPGGSQNDQRNSARTTLEIMGGA